MNIRTRMKSKLIESGLTLADGKKLEIEALSASQVARLQPHYREVVGLFIPYFDTDGKLLDFHRIRYLEGVSDQSEGRKYDGPSGHPPRAYFPRLTDWKRIREHKEIALTITEGELKAACATKLGIPTIGLGGVWNWKSKTLGLSFLPELEAFVWAERRVDLCFDSDIVVKPQVRAALYALARELARRGADLRLVMLPQEGEEKVGLDDFLVAHGVEKYRDLERAHIHTGEAKIRDFLERYVMLKDYGTPYDLEEGRLFQTKQHFVDLTSNQLYQDPEGKERPLSGLWYKSPQRLDTPGFFFDPSTPHRFVPERGINRYCGLAVEPRRGSVEPMLKVIDAVIGKEHRAWFLQWLAYPLQFPTKSKQSTCVYVWGPQGTGKSAIGYVMLDIYGKSTHGFELSEEDVFGNWNDWLSSALFALCDELSFDGSKKSRSVFKRLVTGESAILSEKYQARTRIENRCNFYFTSNSSGGLPLETVSNRRVFVAEVGKPPSKEYMTTVFDRWRKKENGPAHWLHYLLQQVDCSEYGPHRDAPTTEAEKAAIESSATSVELWLAEAMQAPPLNQSDVWTTRQLVGHYHLETGDQRSGIGAMGRAVSHHPETKRLKPTYLVPERLDQAIWALRNADRWLRASAEQIRKEWRKTQGIPGAPVR